MLTPKAFETIVKNLNKFETSRQDFNDVMGLLRKVGADLETKFPQSRTNSNSSIHQKVQGINEMIKSMVDGVGPVNDAQINVIINSLNELTQGLPQADDYTPQSVRDYIRRLKESKQQPDNSQELIDNVGQVTEWLNSDLNNSDPEVKELKRELAKIKTFADNKIPQSTVDRIEQLINNLIPKSKTFSDSKKASANAITRLMDKYEDTRSIGKLENEIDQLKKIEADIKKGDPDAIAFVRMQTNKRFIGKELAKLQKDKRALLNNYRTIVLQNSDTSTRRKNRFNKFLNTYRNGILSFDLSALGIQASQLLAAELGGAVLSLDMKRLANIKETFDKSLRTFGSQSAYNEVRANILLSLIHISEPTRPY